MLPTPPFQFCTIQDYEKNFLLTMKKEEMVVGYVTVKKSPPLF